MPVLEPPLLTEPLELESTATWVKAPAPFETMTPPKTSGLLPLAPATVEGVRAGELGEAAGDGLRVERAGGGAAGVGLCEQGVLAVDDDEAEGFRAGDA